MDLVERVGRDLAEDGEVGPVSGATFTISRFGGREFVPPVTVRMDGLGGYLESMSQDAVEVFPDVPAMEGAYRLLLVHLEESLLSTGGEPYRITIDQGDLVVSRADPDPPVVAAEEAAGGTLRWTIRKH